MTKKKIRLQEYDRVLMELLMKFPAMSFEQIDRVMTLFGYKRDMCNLASRLIRLCGGKENALAKKYKHRKTNRNGYILTRNKYYGVGYAAKNIEDCFHDGIWMYSITKIGQRLLGASFQPPARNNKNLWAYYYQSSLLIQLLAAGVPLDIMSTALDYKRSRKINTYVPMWFMLNLSSKRICLTFFKPMQEIEPYVGPGWSSIAGFVKTTSIKGRDEDYVILVPRDYYEYVADRLTRLSAYRTYLITYDESVSILKNQLKNQDYYIELLASHLGVENFRAINGIGSGIYNGKRVVLYESVSGLIRAYRELRGRYEGKIRDGALAFCLVQKWQCQCGELLPNFPGCRYVAYEQICEPCCV